MSNPWQEWKQKNADKQRAGIVSPIDFINPSTEYAAEELAMERMRLCLDCPKLIRSTQQCRECGCFMKIKTKLAHATCPLNKW